MIDQKHLIYESKSIFKRIVHTAMKCVTYNNSCSIHGLLNVLSNVGKKSWYFSELNNKKKFFLKSIFYKNILDLINFSKKMQKWPFRTAAN